MADELNLNPTITDSEPSNTQFGREPFDVFRQVDMAHMEEENNANNADLDNNQDNDAGANANQNQQQGDNNGAANSQQSQQIFDQNANSFGNDGQQNQQVDNTPPNAYNEGYNKQLVEQLANQAEIMRQENNKYKEFFESPRGKILQQLADEIQAQKAYEEEQAKKNPDGFSESDFRKKASDVLGINEDDSFYSALDKKMSGMINAENSDIRSFIGELKAERENAQKEMMGRSFANHLQQTYNMPDDIALQAAFKAISQADKKYGKKYNQSAYYRELCAFETKEIVPVGISLMKQQLKAAREREQALANASNAAAMSQPNNGGTSTQAAANRMYSQQNANYKANGTIPNGSPIQENYDDGDEVRKFCEFANGHYMG